MVHPNGPWMYSEFECPSCKMDLYLEGTRWDFDLIECPSCKEATYFPATWPARELEPQTHWTFANRIKRDVNEYVQYLNKNNQDKS